MPDYKYRKDLSMPFADIMPMHGDTIVKVYNAYGDSQIDLAKNLWWGYAVDYDYCMDEGVIYKWLILSKPKTL